MDSYEIDEELKRDTLIYDIFTKRLESEYQRTKHLESKATTIAGFVGIIFSLFSPTGITHLEKVKDCNWFLLIILFYIFGLLFLIGTLYCSLLSVYIKVWRTAPNVDHFMDQYVKNGKDRSNILSKLSVEMCHSIKVSENNNESKVQYLKLSIM